MFIKNYKKDKIWLYKVFIIVVIMIIFFVSTAASSEKLSNLFFKNYKTQWNVSADCFRYNYNENIYKLSGNVVIQNDDIRINTDLIYFNYDNMIVKANQGALIQIGEDYLKCQTLKLNLNSETGTILDGFLFLQENNIQIYGSKIEKISKNGYIIDNGSLTTCNKNNQVWIILGEKIKIVKGKHGVVKNAVLKIKKIPIIYLPYLLIPTEKRQSGILYPEIRYSNSTLTYCQPLFLKTGQSSDITIYPSYEFDNNLSIGLEYRYILDQETKGLFMIDWSKKELNNNLDCYWIRSKLNQKLPMDFFVKLGIDLVSDTEYINNYKYGYAGFNKTEQYFKTFIGRDLAPLDNNLRNNYLILNKMWSNFIFSSALYWNTNTIKYNISEIDEVRKKKILLQLDSNWVKLTNLPLYFGVSLKHKRCCIDNSKCIVLIKPKIYIPYTIGNFIFLDLSLNSQHNISKNNNTDFCIATSNNYDFKAEVSSKLSRVFQKNMFSLKHSIGLSVIYHDSRQIDIDNFNHLSKDNCNNGVIAYSITNSITTKTKNNSTSFENKKYIYRNILSFNLKQTFKLNSIFEPFSNITSELYLSPNDNFGLKTYCALNAGKISSYTSEIYIHNKQNYYIVLGYFYEKNEKKILNTSLSFPMNSKFTISITCGYDCIKNERLLGSLGLYYNADCWSANVVYNNDEGKNSSSISFAIDLMGISNHSNQIAKNYHGIQKDNFIYKKNW